MNDEYLGQNEVEWFNRFNFAFAKVLKSARYATVLCMNFIYLFVSFLLAKCCRTSSFALETITGKFGDKPTRDEQGRGL